MKSKNAVRKLKIRQIEKCKSETTTVSSMNAVSFPRALWSGVFDPYVMAEQVFERQLVESVLLCEPHVCELSPQGCSVFVPRFGRAAFYGD